MLLMAEPAKKAQDELAQGELFADRYEILESLGRGGMGAVYHARDLSLGEDIALKLLSFVEDPSPIAVLRFRKEVKLARRVTHPNVARVYDIGEHLGKIYLTMELVHGPTLRAVLRSEHRLAVGRVIEIGRALAAGLSAAHEVGVVHRDLKPSNILIDRSGRVVLSDFGIARGLDDDQSLTTGVLGTPHYMAPEQATGGMIDARVDVYAMGLVLYEMLTGERADTTPLLLADAMRAHSAPPALITLTLHCLERDPGARPRSTSEIAQRLAAIAAIAAMGAADADGTGTNRLPIPVAQMLDTVAAIHVPERNEQPSPSQEIPPDRALAVLPFAYRGKKDNDYLGDVITDELVDVLCRTRSLRVLGSGATSKYREARDARAIGRELGVFAVIDGTVQMAGQKVRISVRLVDADSGVQLWSDHHEGTLEDLFTFQEAIARRVAEELRVEITTITHKRDAPAEAIEQYLSARRLLRRFNDSTARAAAQSFARCIELAPCFTPALAGHAIASVRAWFFDAGADKGINWAELAQASVDRALERAPELAETHLASGMFATQRGDYPAAARALQRALSLAPTCADAHEYLGLLECEAGQGDAGKRRLTLADQLAPELTNALSTVARDHALHGRYEEALSLLAALDRRGGSGPLVGGLARVRIAAWRGDREQLVQMAKDNRFPGIPSWQAMRLYAQAILGAFTAQELEQQFAQLLGAMKNARRRSLATQLEIEVFSSRGELDTALIHLTRCAQLVLIDITWLDHCPLLEPLRLLPGFADARRVVQARVDAIWSSG